jgi:hypothetical protein
MHTGSPEGVTLVEFESIEGRFCRRSQKKEDRLRTFQSALTTILPSF